VVIKRGPLSKVLKLSMIFIKRPLVQRLHRTFRMQYAIDEFAKTGKCSMKKGLLDEIIEDAKKRNHVTHLEILKETIRKQVLCKNLVPRHRGLVSPCACTKRPLVTKGYQIPSLCFRSVGVSRRVDCRLLCLL
jgi:hypothetical protein